MTKNTNKKEEEIKDTLEAQEEEASNKKDSQTSDSMEEKEAEKTSEEKEASEDSGEVLNEFDKLETELSDLKDKYLRLYSEFENYRKRTIKEKDDLRKVASEGLMSALLPVVDDFERAQKANESQEDPAPIKEGFDLIYNKMINIITQKGLKVMETKKGDAFDDEMHEAITQMPVEDESLKGNIVDVVEKGYYLNDKVIRFAKVVIGS